MPEYLMLLLMQVTIFSSITACIIICVKQIFKWVIPPSIGTVMWVILLLRLLCPIFPESSMSVYNLIPEGRSIMYTLTADIDEEITSRADAINPYVVEGTEEAQAETVQPMSYLKPLYPEDDSSFTVGEYLSDAVNPGKTKSENAELANNLNVILLVIYAMGAVSAVSVNLFLYHKSKRAALRCVLPCTDERTLRIYRETAEKIGVKAKKLPPLKYGTSSMLVGCISPTVVYREQENISDHKLSMVFAHELNHYKHMDNFVLLFSTIIASLFWYNPLIWIVRHMLREDIEVMCDSRTIALCDYRRSEYAEMIYDSSSFDRKNVLAGCHVSNGSRQLKHRIRTISRNLENKMLPRIASVVISVCIIVVCLTNPIVSQNIEYKDYIDNYSSLTGESQQTMHLTTHMTVSAYLKQITVILARESDVELAQKIGNGNFENFKRLAASSPIISSDVATKIGSMRTDETLTVLNCALINECIVSLLTEEAITLGAKPTLLLVPKVISVADMESVKAKVSAEDAKILEACYNRGVDGADVKYEYYYTEAMFELILSRISDEDHYNLFNSLYTMVELNRTDLTALCSRLGISEEVLANEKQLYVVVSNITANEKNILRGIIEAAYAGQNEDAYYLKENLEGYTESNIRMIFLRSGYTVEQMLDGYAKLGYLQYEHLSSKNCFVLSEGQLEILEERLSDTEYSIRECYERINDSSYFKVARLRDTEYLAALSSLNVMACAKVRDFDDDGIKIQGATSSGVKSAVVEMYELGLINDYDGTIELEGELSCGQSLYYSYKLICSLMNLH